MTFSLPRYSPREELVNALTHGTGALLSVAALTLMVVHAATHGTASHVVSASVFGATMVLMYIVSTLYHTFQAEGVKRIFRVLDHACIYVLIAGTYTPFTLVTLKGGLGWTLFCIIWGMALLGVLYKIFFINKMPILSVLGYIGMGWTAIMAVRPLLEALPLWGIIWMVIGGVMYTGGVIFYAWEKLPYNHAIWHGFVLAGTASHFITIYGFVLA